jgi:hypothetical protein
MDHAISVNLVANIDRYKQGMQQAKQVGTESLGFIASIFEKIKSMFAGLWDSIKSIFSGVWDKIKSGFNSMADGVAGAFQKLTGHSAGLHSSLDQTKSKMAETEGQSMSLAGKIGITLVAAVVAVTGVVGALTRAGLNVASTFAGLATSSDIAVSQLSRFDDVAARNGMSIKEMGASMASFKKAMAEAAAGDGGDIFDKLGVKVTDSKNALLQTDDVLIATAKKIAGMSSEAEKYDAAAKAGFGGKVQLLEDIAHASNLTSSQTDEQAAAVVRLGKIWHEILPGGKSMWAGIRDSITTSLTPAMTEASTSILEAKNRITDAFQQIFGGGSWLTKLGNLIKDWSQQASKWFDGVAKSATDSTIQMMKWIAAKTGLGNPDAFKPGGAGYIPGAVPLVSGKSTPIVTDAEKEAQKQYDATTKAITEKIAAQKLEAQTGQVLTEGQRMAIQMMVGLRDGTLQLTDAQKIERTAQYSALIAQEAANKQMLDGRAAAEAAAQKEAQSYATLSSQIQGKIDEDKLQLASNLDLTDSQKMLIKLDAELASGKLKLSAAHEAAARAKLLELGVTEQQLKADQAQREVSKDIDESVIARNKLTDALAVEYQMYGKTSDARAIAMVVVDAEIWRQQKLAKLIENRLPIDAQTLAYLEREKALRIQVGQSTLAQTQALQYANQLIDENKRFGLEYIADDKARAAAELAIDADVWQERIRLAGDGTEAQKLLQQQYDVWYRNQSVKPALEEQKQMWTSIEQTAHDTFVSIFDSGKSAFDRLRDALKNGLLDLLYQMTLKKWIINVQASVGTSAAAAAAGSAGSAVAGGASLVGAAGNALSIYKGIGAGVVDLGGSAIAGLGNLVGSNSLSAFGAGFAGNAAGTVTTAAETFANAGMAAEASAASFGAAVSAALPWVAGAVAVASLWKSAFGHGATEVQSQGIRGTASADLLTGQSYQDLHQKGGWFSSDRNWEATTAFTDAMVKQFTQGMQALETSAAGFAKSLGVSADWITGYSKTFDIKLTGDQAKDAQAITDFFSGVSDEIASKLVPNLSDFQKSGETLSTTLQRLAGDFQSTDQVAQLIGKTAAEAFGTAGIESAKAREQLITLADSASALTSQAQSYAQNYLTDAERLVPVQKALDAAMASLGLSSIQTRDQFKSVVNSLDLTTEAGAKQFTAMMALADAFAQVHPAANDAATAVQNAADALKAIKDAGTALLGDVDSSFSVLQKVVEREKAAVQTSIDAHTAAVSKLQSLSQSLHSTLNSMLSPDQQAMARTAGQAQIRAALAIAKAGGPLPDADSLKDALSAVSKSSTDQFGSYRDYLKDLYQTQNDIAALGNVTDDQLSVEQKALAAAQDQLKSLDSVLAKAQDQIDVLKGQSTTLLSIDQAIQGLSTAMLAAQANPVVSATSAINKAYQSSLGRAADSSGLAYWQQQAASGVSASDITQAIANSPEATIRGMYETMLGRRDPSATELNYWLTQVKNGVSLGDVGNAIAGSTEAKMLHPFAVGTNFIPEDMPAMVHKGERIIPAADNRALMARLANPSSNNDALIAEIRDLRATVVKQQATLDKIAQSTGRHAEMFENATAGGGPMLVEIA